MLQGSASQLDGFRLSTLFTQAASSTWLLPTEFSSSAVSRNQIAQQQLQNNAIKGIFLPIHCFFWRVLVDTLPAFSTFSLASFEALGVIDPTDK